MKVRRWEDLKMGLRKDAEALRGGGGKWKVGSSVLFSRKGAKAQRGL